MFEKCTTPRSSTTLKTLGGSGAAAAATVAGELAGLVTDTSAGFL